MCGWTDGKQEVGRVIFTSLNHIQWMLVCNVWVTGGPQTASVSVTERGGGGQAIDQTHRDEQHAGQAIFTLPPPPPPPSTSLSRRSFWA